MRQPLFDPMYLNAVFAAIFLVGAVGCAVAAWSDRRTVGTDRWFGFFLLSSMTAVLLAGAIGFSTNTYTQSAWWPVNQSPYSTQDTMLLASVLGAAFFILVAWLASRPRGPVCALARRRS